MAVNPRAALVRLHRWLGLASALVLVLMGLTGSLLAFEQEIEDWLNPRLFLVSSPPQAQLLDAVELHRRIEAALPGSSVDVLTLRLQEGRAVKVAAHREGAGPLAHDEVFFDPYTGRMIGARAWGASPFDRRTFVTFVYRLHRSLALPINWGVGILGFVAVAWTIDCFVGLALTFPRRKKQGSAHAFSSTTQWFARWFVGWRIKPGSSAIRLNFDLHRAAGLWLWIMLLIFAWSSVMLTFRSQVYDPVMSAFLRFDEPLRRLPHKAVHEGPDIGWSHALTAGRLGIRKAARQHNFEIEHDAAISRSRSRGVYTYWVRSSLDIRDNDAATGVILDAGTAAVRGVVLPRSPNAPGNAFTQWMYGLHMAQVWGTPYRVFVFVLGLVVAVLGVTGVLIWWIKQRAKRPKLR